MILGVNQSWRVVPDADAHFAIDHDQYDFDNPEAAGHGGRDYYMRLHKARAAFHSGSWGLENFGVKLDRHDSLIFGRHPFKKRHRDHKNIPPLSEDGGFSLRVNLAGGKGSSGYAALQLAAASEFERIWMVGFDQNDRKFDGAHGYDGFGKKTPVTVGAWSNSPGQEQLWKAIPRDVKERVRVIEPSAIKALEVVPWPWSNA
jgi:hypothetical protein